MRNPGVTAFPVWRLQLRKAQRRRRLLGWNFLVPVVLLLPVALSAAAAPHRSVVYSLFVVFFGTFGSCIPLVGDRARGWNEKVLLTGYPASRWLAERLAAEAAIDTIQLTPTLLLLLWIGRADPGVYGLAMLAVGLALLAANAIGSVIAALVDSVAEAALVCGTAALLVLHLSGVFRVPVTGSWGWRAERMSSFRPLSETMDRMAGVGVRCDIGVGDWLAPLLATAALLALGVSFAPRVASSASRAGLARRPDRPLDPV